jgi:hypothetical protein
MPSSPGNHLYVDGAIDNRHFGVASTIQISESNAQRPDASNTRPPLAHQPPRQRQPMNRIDFSKSHFGLPSCRGSHQQESPHEIHAHITPCHPGRRRCHCNRASTRHADRRRSNLCGDREILVALDSMDEKRVRFNALEKQLSERATAMAQPRMKSRLDFERANPDYKFETTQEQLLIWKALNGHHPSPYGLWTVG